MKSKSLVSAVVVLFFLVGFFCIGIESPSARTLTLKVSHQFAAGDVRDQMARVFGDKITEMTNGEIKFRYLVTQKAQVKTLEMMLG